MALQENLTEENVKDLKKVFDEKIALENPKAIFKTFPMADHERIKLMEESIASLELQVSELTAYIKSVFDGHILIDGQFRKINA